eukprot:g4247.t1
MVLFGLVISPLMPTSDEKIVGTRKGALSLLSLASEPSTRQWSMMVSIPIASFFIIWFFLRVVWPPPPKKEKVQSGPASENTPLNSHSVQVREEGDVAGDYSAPWTETFDLVFLIFMAVSLVLLCLATHFFKPELWHNKEFWICQLPKLFVMMAVSLVGGAVCRRFCDVDSEGYIITNKDSWFKVNYTPWGDWFTLMAFLVLIKPIRERSSFFMLQFNSLDRPEDRPNTLNWIIAGNILPGLILIILFRFLYSYKGQQHLAYIFIMITGIGDGLAEPVGMWWGRHKYLTASFTGGPMYQRSLEGSACVFLSCMIFCTTFWYAFANERQYWACMVLLAPLMTWAEATSPHTMDTPFLMGLGGLVILIVINTL